MDRSLTHQWAALVSYPGGERAERLPLTISEIERGDSFAVEDLRDLNEFIANEGGTALEELFVRTFENNAERALEVGWHLHGENYARGSFMARMRGLLRDLGIEESVELPDHMSHMLAMLAETDDETSAAMARGVVCPALDKIEAGFSDDGNPYLGVIRGLNKYLTRTYGQRHGDASDE